MAGLVAASGSSVTSQLQSFGSVVFAKLASLWLLSRANPESSHVETTVVSNGPRRTSCLFSKKERMEKMEERSLTNTAHIKITYELLVNTVELTLSDTVDTLTTCVCWKRTYKEVTVLFLCRCSWSHDFNVSRPVLWQDDGQRISVGRLWREYHTLCLTGGGGGGGGVCGTVRHCIHHPLFAPSCVYKLTK